MTANGTIQLLFYLLPHQLLRLDEIYFLCLFHSIDEALTKARDKNFLYHLGWQHL